MGAAAEPGAGAVLGECGLVARAVVAGVVVGALADAGDVVDVVVGDDLGVKTETGVDISAGAGVLSAVPATAAPPTAAEHPVVRARMASRTAGPAGLRLRNVSPRYVDGRRQNRPGGLSRATAERVRNPVVVAPPEGLRTHRPLPVQPSCPTSRRTRTRRCPVSGDVAGVATSRTGPPRVLQRKNFGVLLDQPSGLGFARVPCPQHSPHSSFAAPRTRRQASLVH